MEGFSNGTGRDQAAFMGALSPSFTRFLSSYNPGLLPLADLGQAAGSAAAADLIKNLPHATTIVAVACEGGVVMAGDRRATAGNMISKRDVDKVFPADEYSVIAIAGALAFALELTRLFGVELEHYEKMEGRPLSLEGKANRLGKMIRDNLSAAMQGLAVIPLFAGYDENAGAGRIFSYDVAGGPYEEHRFHSIGSGSVFAKSALKKYYADGMSVSDAALACVQALYDAADDDSATGGPDLTRQIFPVITTVTADGFNRLSDEEAAGYGEQVVRGRMTMPDGPSAPLRSVS
ncbi:MAG TPA: proteasome subunit beta [Trebonia sp.]|jgi:proteasome beta subunit|nr:proteasome subunit beta [Trebonia sp.]